MNVSAEPDRPVDVDGTFHATHWHPDGSVVAEFEGPAGCLMGGADVAVMTGVITKADNPLCPRLSWSVGRVGITVDDHGRRDRIGWSWMVMGFYPVSGCTSTAPFFPVSIGDLAVDSPRG